MRRVELVVTLLVISLTGFAYSGCQTAETTQPSRETGSIKPEPEKVDKAAIEAELINIQNDWPRVLKEKDTAAVRRVEADDLLIVYPDGSLGNREQDIKDIESGVLTAESWEMADFKVNVLSADAAVVSGRSVVKGGKYKGADGKAIDISGQYRFVDTFARRNGEWKLVASAAVPIRNPPK